MNKLGADLLRWVLFTAAALALLMLLAGRIDDPMLWAYGMVLSGITLAAIRTMDPDLLRERRSPAPGGIDRRRGPVISALFLLQLVGGALDAGRLHWSPAMPLSARLAGLGVFAAAMALVVRSAAVNRYFSPVVRIQSERGHRLVTAGPYRLLRHPGYLGMALAFPASAAALGSWFALAIALVSVGLILRRVVLEDRYLRANLPGYSAYAESVRYRLVPGLW